MKPWKVVLLILFALAVAAAGYGLSLVRRGFSALATPSVIEELAATTARKLAVPSSYRELRNPITPSTENIRGGMEHFAFHCSPCHSNDGDGHTVYGKGLYPKPPDLRAAGTQNKGDGELYYTIDNGVRLSGMPAFSGTNSIVDCVVELAIDNGVRLSGMPAFSGTHTAAQTWRLVLFIRHLPEITPEELIEMKGWNSKMEADPSHF
jgi:mono/diheme cytochrome c family protein